ncbi:aminoacylase 1-like protein 2 [Mycena pura]|uniref:Peptidase M20 domain-containing protein 2 n=1 Tax=Mycena pura TaxID=153505 RepID=A0AAD6V658_9AGAR|nr:aminoacylase 1-like protein 2 [Mycena pura]
MTNSSPLSLVWRPEDTSPAVAVAPGPVYREDILEIIEQTINGLDGELRQLSMDIHDHPELAYEERHAHDVLTAFMAKHGFEVTKQYHLETAWLASYSAPGADGRTIGINSEMDALPRVGHACGHNLIAIAGVAVACAIKAVFEKIQDQWQDPASRNTRCHPAPGPKGSVSLSSCLARELIEVEYFGHTAHAALSPWEGTNALDAAVLGYNNISALRQQLRPTHRVHGVFEGKDWAANVIPDYAKFICYVRAPTRAEQEQTMKRVLPCFEAAALATGCTVKITNLGAVYDLRQNKALSDEVAHIARSKYGAVDYEWGIKSASTDFGNVTYELPSLHPGFAIPTIVDGGNHTPGFEKAAGTMAAHYACLDVSKALAATGVRVVIDDEFYAKVQKTFEDDKAVRDLVYT